MGDRWTLVLRGGKRCLVVTMETGRLVAGLQVLEIVRILDGAVMGRGNTLHNARTDAVRRAW